LNVTDLLEEVKDSFRKGNMPDTDGPQVGPIRMVTEHDNLVGFGGMSAAYHRRITDITRKGYRRFAGSTLPDDPEDKLITTGEYMYPKIIATLVQAFCDGIMLGQQDNFQVLLAVRLGAADSLFHDEGFRAMAKTMALGFIEDEGIKSFFLEYYSGALISLAQLTGFAQGQMPAGKVWDLWILSSKAVVGTCYVAGYHLGSAWKERDVLDGIEIVTEESDIDPR